MSNQDYKATPDRPKWVVDAEAGEIRRFTSETDEGELIAKYDAPSGVVELEKGKAGYRLPITNVMKGQNGGHFERFGKIGAEEKAPVKAPAKPNKSFSQGEKTKDRVIWEARYMPETFKGRWGVERLQVRTGFEQVERIRTKQDGTGDRERYMDSVPVYQDVNGLDFEVDKLLSGEQRLIARAKTCITAVAEQSPDLTEYDDSLDAPADEGI